MTGHGLLTSLIQMSAYHRAHIRNEATFNRGTDIASVQWFTMSSRLYNPCTYIRILILQELSLFIATLRNLVSNDSNMQYHENEKRRKVWKLILNDLLVLI